MQITKRVTFIAKEGHQEELKKLLEAMVEPSKAEDGCLNYNIYQYKENPRKFMAVETWASEEALEGHKNSAHYKVYKSSYEPHTEHKYTDELDYLVTIS
jgi:quinol monooxygenase YgiN